MTSLPQPYPPWQSLSALGRLLPVLVLYGVVQPVADLSGEPALVQTVHLVLARQVQPQQLLPLRHLQVRVGIVTNRKTKKNSFGGTRCGKKRFKSAFYMLLCSHVYSGLLHRTRVCLVRLSRIWAKQSSRYTVIYLFIDIYFKSVPDPIRILLGPLKSNVLSSVNRQTTERDKKSSIR